MAEVPQFPLSPSFKNIKLRVYSSFGLYYYFFQKSICTGNDEKLDLSLAFRIPVFFFFFGQILSSKEFDDIISPQMSQPSIALFLLILMQQELCFRPHVLEKHIY